MNKIVSGLLLGVGLTACGPYVSDKMNRTYNEFRGSSRCAADINYLAKSKHNSGSVNFELVQTQSKDQSFAYVIVVDTKGELHHFPWNAIMHLSLDNQPPIKLTAFGSNSEVSGYYVGDMYSINIYDFAIFPVQKEVIEKMAQSKNIKFAVEGRTKKLEAEFSPENLIPVKSFVANCIHGQSFKEKV